MLNGMRRWWERQNTRWNKGGGYVAARLWWLAFFLFLLLFVMAVPPLGDSDHHPVARQTVSLSNLKQLGTCLQMYVQDYDERLPPMHTVTAARHALQPYTKGRFWQTFPPQPAASETTYAVNPALSLRPLAAYSHPDRIVAFWETRLIYNTHPVLFLDGHAKVIRLEDWSALRSASGITRDVPAPPEPLWWRTRTPEDFASDTFVALVCVAVGAMFRAAWLEAWYRAGERGHTFLPDFIGWFLLRFFGYGFCVLLTALGASLLFALFCAALRIR